MRLPTNELLRDLDEPSADAVLGVASRAAVAAGSMLLKQGDAADRLFLVEHGRFKMSVLSDEGQQLTLRFMAAGDLIGCAAFFGKFPYPATAIAVEDSQILAWSRPQFEALMARYPALAKAALSIVSGRADHMVQRLREHVTEPAEQRIARAIVRLLQQQQGLGDQGLSDQGLGDGASSQLRIARQDLAELSGATLYTVSRTISAWSRARIVAGSRGRLLVRDRAALVKIAEGKLLPEVRIPRTPAASGVAR